jgi:hypothetical protein
MEIKQKDGKWFAKKNKKAKTWEDVSSIIQFDGDLCSVMGKAGRTNFHAYLGREKDRWLEMYGTTSILNYWGEKDRLTQWAVDQAVEYIKGKATELSVSDVGLPFDVLEEARSAHTRSMEEAGAHGTDKHALVEDYVKAKIGGHTIENPEIQPFIDWAQNITFLESEKPLYSRRLWCAGTTDFICEINGLRFIGDLKTSRYVSFKQFVQCGAYALMYEEMGLGQIDGVLIAHMPRDGGFNIHIDMNVIEYKMAFEYIVWLAKLDKNKSYSLFG